MVICLNYGYFEKKKLRSMIISQSHYLNKICEVHPLKATRKLMLWYLEQQENSCFVFRATRKSMLKVIRTTRKSMPQFQGPILFWKLAIWAKGEGGLQWFHISADYSAGISWHQGLLCTFFIKLFLALALRPINVRSFKALAVLFPDCQKQTYVKQQKVALSFPEQTWRRKKCYLNKRFDWEHIRE